MSHKLDAEDQSIIIMTNKAMPGYVWIHITLEGAEEHADKFYTEAIPDEFTIERVIEHDRVTKYKEGKIVSPLETKGKFNNWETECYTIQNFLRDRMRRVGYDGYYEVRKRSGIFKLRDRDEIEDLIKVFCNED